MKNWIVALLVGVFAGNIQAQQVVTNKTEPAIEVTGFAEREIVPDEIYIAIHLVERTEERTKLTIEKQETDLKKAIQGLGISLENLSLSDADASYVKVKWNTKEVITRKNYVLKVSSAVEVGKVYEQLERLGIQGAYIARVDHSKLEQFKKDIQVDAIKNAKEKADYLLAALGEKTGRPLIVNENFNTYQPVYTMDHTQGNYKMLGSVSESVSDGMPELSFQKIKLQATIYVKFEIK